MGWEIWGLNPGKGKKFFSSPKCPDWLWGPTILLYRGYWGFFKEVKQPGCEVDHSPPSSAEVKNEWSCTSNPPICLHGMEKEGFYPSFSDNDLWNHYHFIFRL